MKKYLYISILLVIFSGCKSEKENIPPEIPENIIPKEQMVDILVDVQLLEAAMKVDDERKRKSKEYTNYYYSYLFEKYDITRNDFLESLEFYQRHIDLFDEIYADVIKQLSKFQSEIELNR